MKFLHTSSWHLGHQFYGYSRTAEHRRFLRFLHELLLRERPDALLLSGPVFHGTQPGAEAESLFFDFVARAEEALPGLQFIVTTSAADGGAWLEAAAPLLRRHNVYVRSRVTLTEKGTPDFADLLLPLARRGSDEACCVCFALPLLRPADYPAGMTPGEGCAFYMDNLRKELKRSDFRTLPYVVQAPAGLALPQALPQPGAPLALSFEESERHPCVHIVTLDPDTAGTTIDRVDCPPPTSLLTLPLHGAATATLVRDAIAALPRRGKSDAPADYPYLRLRLSEATPPPGLLDEFLTALADRAVRFCCIRRELPPSAATAPEPLGNLRPVDFARSAYREEKGEGMPPALVEKLREAIEKASSAQAQ